MAGLVPASHACRTANIGRWITDTPRCALRPVMT
jgi:hypothetical protein